MLPEEAKAVSEHQRGRFNPMGKVEETEEAPNRQEVVRGVKRTAIYVRVFNRRSGNRSPGGRLERILRTAQLGIDLSVLIRLAS